MNKTEIIATTEEKFQDLIDFLEGQDDKNGNLDLKVNGLPANTSSISSKVENH